MVFDELNTLQIVVFEVFDQQVSLADLYETRFNSFHQKWEMPAESFLALRTVEYAQVQQFEALLVQLKN